MSNEKKPPEPMRAGAKAEEQVQTQTITFDPNDRASIERAMHRLKMARGDLDAADRAAQEAETAKRKK